MTDPQDHFTEPHAAIAAIARACQAATAGIDWAAVAADLTRLQPLQLAWLLTDFLPVLDTLCAVGQFATAARSPGDPSTWVDVADPTAHIRAQVHVARDTLRTAAASADPAPLPPCLWQLSAAHLGVAAATQLIVWRPPASVDTPRLAAPTAHLARHALHVLVLAAFAVHRRAVSFDLATADIHALHRVETVLNGAARDAALLVDVLGYALRGTPAD